MNRIIYLIFIFLLTITDNSYSQAPKYSNEFLAIGVGARSLGMSNSAIASVNDVTAGYWNPSRLHNMTADRQLSFMHAEYFAGIAKYDYVGVGAIIDDRSAVALSVIRFGVDNIPNTTELVDNQRNINYDKITTFSAYDMAILLSFGRQGPSESIWREKNISYGGSIKIIRRKIGDFANAWGFGLDGAISYVHQEWFFAAVARDVTSTFNAWSFSLSDRMKEVFTITGNEIPENSLEITMPRLLLGGGRKINISPSFYILPEVGLDITTDGKRNVPLKTNVFSIDPHLGIEFSFKQIIYFRAGIGNIQQETSSKGEITTTFQPNMGIGLQLGNTISLNYALTDIGDQSIALYSNIFSLYLSFNKSK